MGNPRNFIFSEGEVTEYFRKWEWKIPKKTSDSKLTSQKYDIHANKENFAPIINQPLGRSNYRRPLIIWPPGTYKNTKYPMLRWKNHGGIILTSPWAVVAALYCFRQLDCKQTKMVGSEINIKPTSRYLIFTISSPNVPAVAIRFSDSQIKFWSIKKVSWKGCA